MKTIVLGGIHGNLPALSACFEQAEKEGYDWMVCTGDIVGYGPYPDECARFLYDRNIPSVRGLVDDLVVSGEDASAAVPPGAERDQLDAALAWTRGRMQTATRLWLAGLPFELRRAAGSARMAVYHAGPVSLRDLLMPGMPQEVFAEAGRAAGAGIVVLGRAPEPFHHEVGGVHFVNAPTLGIGTRQTGYAVVESDAVVHVTFRRLDYDARPLAAAARLHQPQELWRRFPEG